jgi:hypothetical protein
MQVLQQKIQDFTYSNLTETVVLWDNTTTYVVGQTVRVGAYIYESVTASNLNNDPLLTENVRWLKVGVSNKFAMLDLRANTKSVTMGDSTVVEFTQNYIDTLAIGNYEASTILVEVLNGATLLWSYETPPTLDDYVYDWWDWTYEDYNYETNRALMVKLGVNDLSYKVRVTFKFNSTLEMDRTGCGFLVGGVALDMGKTAYGVNFSFNSFAQKEFDDKGNFTVKKSSIQDLVDFNTTMLLTEKSMPKAKREIKSFYDDVVVFIVDENEDSHHENMLTLGTVQDASVVLNNEVLFNIAWSVLEVI